MNSRRKGKRGQAFDLLRLIDEENDRLTAEFFDLWILGYVVGRTDMKMIVAPWSVWWWRYILARRTWRGRDVHLAQVIWCRLRNHPAGVVWYNAGGTEPDMHCRHCGDDLG